jgi:GNAT superfamily N-acetyltransferase
MADHFWSDLIWPSGTKRFEALTRPMPDPPVNTEYTKATYRDVPALGEFLERHFGSPPKSPVFRPVLDPAKEIILFVRDRTEIVASIRYRYAGRFDGHPIHLIDCFCIHPLRRRTGLATALLTALHHYTMGRGLQFSLFLKEGRALPHHRPLYSSSYVFRGSLSAQKPGHLKRALSPRVAEALVRAWLQLHPGTLWIYDVGNTNQQWFFWKEGFEWILFCVQDSWQMYKGGRIGWMTACFASEPMRGDRFEELVDSVPYAWVWMDRAWLPEDSSSKWISDGCFHWYAYQWHTNATVKRFYGLVV